MKTKRTLLKIISVLFMHLTVVILSGCTAQGVDTPSSSAPAVENPDNSTPQPSPSPVTVTTRKMKNLGIYYGWVTGIDNVHNIDYNNRVDLAATEIAKYDRFILGAGLEDSSHPDYANTVTVITKVREKNLNTQLYGYVCVGTCSGANPNITSIRNSIDKWDAMNVDGIFFDEAGFDYAQAGDTADSDTRARLASAVSYAHSVGLKSMINAWDPDDIFVKEPGNPIPWQSGDSFLFESYMYAESGNSIVLSDAGLFSAFRTRINKAVLNKPAGVELWGVSTTGEAVLSFNSTHWNNLVEMAWADDLAGIGWGTKNYSAVDNSMPFRAIPNSLLNLRFDQKTAGSSGMQVKVTDANNTQTTLDAPFSLSP